MPAKAAVEIERPKAKLRPKEVEEREAAKAATEAALAWLRETWPNLFGETAKSLRLGIRRELVQLKPPHFGTTALSRALGRWCSNEGYLRALADGDVRYGLDSEPAGEVTDRDREHAAERLTRRARRNKPDCQEARTQ